MNMCCLVKSASNSYYRVGECESEIVFLCPSSPALAKKMS